MSKRRGSTQYTIRQVPPAVDRALRLRALALKRSLNKVAADALAVGAGVAGHPTRHHDLDFFFGSWIPDRSVDRALAAQRKIDDELWK